MSAQKNRSPRLVIVGRPNVGKSTLFNRLLGRRRALVHDEPGVTRDRLLEPVEWRMGKRRVEIELVDTGGLGGDRWATEIERQVQLGLSEADVVLVLLDSQTGLIPQDRDVLKRLKQSGLLDSREKIVIGIANKVDDHRHEDRVAELYASGVDPILPVSAEHGRGIDDLKLLILDRLTEKGWDFTVQEEEDPFEDEEPARESASEEDDFVVDLDVDGEESEEALEEAPREVEAELPEWATRTPRIAIVGRPNVGKSTLVNALLGEERMIASPVAGTTVDSVDSEAMLGDRKFILIDTAGIRRKSKTEKGVEVLSVVQSRKALERCDVAILLLDGETGITDQDEKIGGMIEDVGCGVVLALNKWDTQRGKKGFGREEAAEIIRKEMAFLRYAPLLFVSAKQRRGLQDLGDLCQEIIEQRRVRVPTKALTEWVRKASTIHNPMNAKFYMAHQSGRNPPTFVFHVSDPDRVHFSLRRHLANGLRELWGYMGSPIKLLFVKGTSTRKADPKKARKSMSKTKRGEDRLKRGVITK